MNKIFAALPLALAFSLTVGTAFAASSKSTAQVGAIAALEANAAQMSATGAQAEAYTTIMKNTIKTANPSDLLADVSLECGIYTDTTVRSKGGTKDTSTANAGVKVRVLVDGEEMLPGPVTFCSRKQEMSAVFQGIFSASDECAVAVLDEATGEQATDEFGNLMWDFDLDCLAGECLTVENDAIVIDETCLLPEELQLLLETMNANAFNFMIPDVGVGTHTIEVQAHLFDNQAVQAGEAASYSFLGKGSVAVEEVKMIKGEDIVLGQ